MNIICGIMAQEGTEVQRAIPVYLPFFYHKSRELLNSDLCLDKPATNGLN